MAAVVHQPGQVSAGVGFAPDVPLLRARRRRDRDARSAPAGRMTGEHVDDSDGRVREASEYVNW